MPLARLENLARIGQLKAEPAAQAKIDGLLRSGKAWLKNAGNPTSSPDRIAFAHPVDRLMLISYSRTS